MWHHLKGKFTGFSLVLDLLPVSIVAETIVKEIFSQTQISLLFWIVYIGYFFPCFQHILLREDVFIIYTVLVHRLLALVNHHAVKHGYMQKQCQCRLLWHLQFYCKYTKLVKNSAVRASSGMCTSFVNCWSASHARHPKCYIKCSTQENKYSSWLLFLLLSLLWDWTCDSNL